MNKTLSYINEKGFTVFTSYYLKLKGSCCKCSCLHCPYGYTVDKYGFSFEKLNTQEPKKLLPKISYLFEGANLHPQKDLIYLIYLKDNLCGLLSMKDSAVDKFYLLEPFLDQNICKEIISKSFHKLNSSNQTKNHKRSYKN